MAGLPRPLFSSIVCLSSVTSRSLWWFEWSVSPTIPRWWPVWVVWEMRPCWRKYIYHCGLWDVRPCPMPNFSLTFMLEVQDVSAFCQFSVSASMPACFPSPLPPWWWWTLVPPEPKPKWTLPSVSCLALGMVLYYSSRKLLELAFTAFTETPLGLSVFGYPSTGCERGQSAGV